LQHGDCDQHGRPPPERGRHKNAMLVRTLPDGEYYFWVDYYSRKKWAYVEGSVKLLIRKPT
jgi:hypothetical protein